MVAVLKSEQISKELLEALEWFVEEHLHLDQETALMLASNITPKRLKTEELAPSQSSWQRWLTNVLAKDVKKAYLWWSSAKELGWFNVRDLFHFAELTLERDPIFLKELFKDTASETLPEVVRLIEKKFQSAIDHPLNFSKSDKQAELIDILNHPFFTSLSQKEILQLEVLTR